MQRTPTRAVSVQTKPRPSSGACEPPAWVQSCYHPILLPGDPLRGWGRVGSEGRNPRAPEQFSLTPLPPFLGTPPTQPSQPHPKPRGLYSGLGAPWGLRDLFAPAGEVNITVSTEALSSTEPCGNELPLVPAQGRVDTVIKPLLVQVRGLWRRKMGWIWELGANSPWGAGQEHPDMKPG